jgi:hypothetical protein
VSNPFRLAGDRALTPTLERPDESDPVAWLRTMFPAYTRSPFASHHLQLWAWVWAIQPGLRPDPLVAILPRGGAKSTSAEMAVAALGCMDRRRYGLYVCGTQDQADDHVSNIGSLLELPSVAEHYPEMGDRLVGKHGNSKGWRVNRLRTASGFTIDAVGLDTAARGVKLEDARPDFLIVDDIDGEHDNPAATRKKITTLTRALIPAGSPDLATLAIQNLIHPNSVFAKLAGLSLDGAQAEFLRRRIVIGPIPAVVDLTVEDHPTEGYVVTGGTPTWEGQNLQIVQGQVNDWGFSAFMAEAQHDVEPPPGGMFSHLHWRRTTWDQIDLRTMVRVVCWIDPAVTDKDQSDSQAIQIDGLGRDGLVYRLWSWEQRSSPLDTVVRALRKATELGAESIGIETDQGGDTWGSVYREAVAMVRTGADGLKPLDGEFEWVPPRFRSDKAGAGYGPKSHRASLMLSDYERGRFVHVMGTHLTLERALFRFPLTKPFDLTDAAFWSWHDLTGAGGGPVETDDRRLRGRRAR